MLEPAVSAVLPPHPRSATASHVARFVQEAQVTGQLEHPGIVPVYELGVDANDRAFYTMKFVRGVTLRDVVKKLQAGDAETVARYTLNRCLNVFLKICEAVAFAHSRNVIHRDLKPENIMVGRHGEVFVMDWGLAKILGTDDAAGAPDPGASASIVQSIRSEPDADTSRTLDGQVMGTPAYMAPEQAEGLVTELDERTDIVTSNPTVPGWSPAPSIASVQRC